MDVPHLRLPRRSHLLHVVFAWLIALPQAGAQEQETEAAKQLVRDAYAATQTAKTVEDFSRLIDLCVRAEQQATAGPLRSYVQELFAWAHNRRGELHSEQAARLQAAGKSQESRAADRQALEDFESACQRNPDYWKAMHNRGVSRAVGGEFDAALEDFNRVVELKPDYANAWFNRAEIRFERRDFDAALGDYAEAVRLNPRDVESLLRRGLTLLRLQRLTDALDDFNRAASLDPQRAESVTSRGDIYRQLGDWRKAAEDYRRALELDPSYAPAYLSAAWLMATCPDERYRDAERAVRTAQKGRELVGADDPLTWDVLAAAYANAGDFPKAGAAITRAVEASPPEERPPLEKRKSLYAERTPYRESAADSTPAEPRSP